MIQITGTFEAISAYSTTHIWYVHYVFIFCMQIDVVFMMY